MSIRRSHGRGAHYGAPFRVETQPIDEQAPGVRLDDQLAPGGEDRDQRGRFTGPSPAQRRGGRQQARKASLRRLVRESLGFGDLPDDHELRPHIDRAAAWLSRELGHLSENVLGGEEPPPDCLGVALCAAKALASAEWTSDRGLRMADPDLVARSARLSTEFRNAVISARELAAKHAQARPARGNELPPWLDAPSEGGTS